METIKKNRIIIINAAKALNCYTANSGAFILGFFFFGGGGAVLFFFNMGFLFFCFFYFNMGFLFCFLLVFLLLF